MNPTQEKEKDLITNPLATKVQPSVSANDLASPVTVPTMTQPQVGTLPTSPVVNNVAKETGNIIAAKTAEAEDLAKLRKEYGALSQQGSLTDLFNEQLQQGGVTDESFRELKDINLQLADRGTASELTKTRIQGAAGQTLGQAGREVTQEDREAAVRDAGLAARAAVLQGSIETAQAAATQAVNIAFQDRQLTNTNLINQINDLSGVVDDQTQQLLDQKKQQYEADQAKIKELKDNIANAMVSGASQAEINRLTDPTTTDEDKLALAQSITARGATELRNLDIQQKEASILASQASATNAGRRQTQIVDIDGVKTLVDTQTGEVISEIKGDGSTADALGTALAENEIGNITDILNSSAIGSAVGPSGLARTEPGLWGAAKRFFTGALAGGAAAGLAATPTVVGVIPAAIVGALVTGTVNAARGSMSELTGEKQNFIGSVENMRAGLTKDKLAQAKGQGVTFGALSDGERGLIADAATKLGVWAVHEGNDPAKPVIGYNIDEKNFLREIDTINYFKKLDALLQGSTPESIGAVAQTESDGTTSYWVANSDGTLSQLTRQ